MSSVSLSCLVAFCWGLGASWDAWVAKRIDPWVGVAWRLFYGLTATLVFTVAGVAWFDLSGPAWFWLSAAGVFLALGWLCYMQALRRDHSELSVALSATYILPAVLILLLLGAKLSWPILLACFLVAAGSFVANASARSGTHGLLWAAGASLLWGFWVLASWQASEQASPIELMGGGAVVAVAIGLLLTLAVWGQGKSMSIPRSVAAVKLSGWVLNGFATWLMFLAFDRGPAAQVMVISAAYPIVALSLGYLFFKNRWSARKLLAVLLLCAGACLAALAKNM